MLLLLVLLLHTNNRSPERILLSSRLPIRRETQKQSPRKNSAWRPMILQRRRLFRRFVR